MKTASESVYSPRRSLLRPYQRLVRPILFRLSADRAHDLAVSLASKAPAIPGVLSLLRWMQLRNNPELSQQLLGLTFPNPVGIAAGFDKNAVCIPFLQALGLGFIEIGSVTALARPGNPKPRSFRLPRDASLINRLGLNNQGAETVCQRLSRLGPPLRMRPAHSPKNPAEQGPVVDSPDSPLRRIPIAVNIAKTHDPAILGTAAHEDYAESFRHAKNVADFITLNISCPNTAEGKTFEEPDALAALLQDLDLASDPGMPPVLVKISPDLAPSQIQELVTLCQNRGLSGFVACNTSTRREGLQTPVAELERIGKGGLSGQAIRERATQTIRQIRETCDDSMVIVGVGGIAAPEHAWEKLQAGANLLQIYTGLVYEGPDLIPRINAGIAAELRSRGQNSL